MHLKIIVFPFFFISYFCTEFRNYNVIVYPTDARGSTYIPSLFRPTGFYFLFINFFLYIVTFNLVKCISLDDQNTFSQVPLLFLPRTSP